MDNPELFAALATAKTEAEKVGLPTGSLDQLIALAHIDDGKGTEDPLAGA